MQSDKKVTVNVTNRTIFRTILWVVGTVLVFNFVERITHALTLILVSLFLAMALNPVVSWMRRRLGLRSRVRATAAAYLMVVLILGGFFTLIIPPLVRQTRDFAKEVPTLVRDFQQSDSGLSQAVERYNLDDKLSKAARDFASEYSDIGGTALDTGKRVLGVLASVLIVVVLTFMMLVEGPKWLERGLQLVPTAKREHHRRLAYRMYRAVSGFVNGQVLLAVLAGTSAFIALTIASKAIDVSVNAAALAGIVAVFALIPMFGNIISATIVVLICLLSSVTLGLVMLGFFIVYQQIENVSLQPYIQSKVNQLTPLTVFVAALVGVTFGGLLGAIFAIPTAGAIKVLLEDQLARRGFKAASTETK